MRHRNHERRHSAISGLPISNDHTWTTGGAKTITATGQSSCRGTAATTVTVNAPPVVSVTAPGSGASYYAPATIALAAAASDGDGSVTQVQF
jgi:hypothetical protein